MTIEQVRPDEDRIRFLVQNLRERDREELYGLRWNDSEDELIRDVLGYAGAMSWVWEVDGVPVSIQGSCPVRPGVWSNWCFGTDRWPEAVLSMTRWARHYIIPALLGARFHRAEALSLMSHQDARGWIEALGGRLESVMRGAGRAGQDYAVYVWTPDDVRRRR